MLKHWYDKPAGFIEWRQCMGTFIVGSLVLLIVAAIITKMVKDKKNGKSIQCGGDCGHCGGHCHGE